MVQIVTPEQWYKVNYRYPVFYNDSDDIAYVNQDRGGTLRTIVMVLPGHILQLIEEQAYFTRITQAGTLDQFLIYSKGEDMLKNKDRFKPESYLRPLREQLAELKVGES